MEDDDSSIELIYEDSLGPFKVKEEENDVEAAAEEEECMLIEENDNNDNFIQDKDPMDLLELLEKRPNENEPESKDTSDNEEESESVVSSVSAEVSKSKLLSNYDWSFAEGDNVWCLYCDTTLKTAADCNLSKHQNSITHTERAKAYLSFLNQLNKDVYRLSSNRDFDGNVNEVKNHRKSLDEDFANYLWDKWEEAHDWLIRTDVKFTAYCKYCHQKIGVGTSYLRKQHEDGAKHREFKNKAPKRRATFCGDLQSFQAENLTSDPESQETVIDDTTEKETTSKWYEKSKSSSDLCRCKLCDITMFQTSFGRHTSSNLHRQNLSALDNPGLSEKLIKPDWKTIQKDHEWLIEDSTDPMEAYCKYCKKRLAYGSSVAKRLIHEHSSAHRAAEQNFFTVPVTEDEKTVVKKNEENTQEGNGIVEDDFPQDNSESEESEESNKSEESTKKKRRKRNIARGTFPWVKPYKKDPRFIICHYCKVLLRKNVNGKKHETALRHQNAEKLYLEKQGIKNLLKNQSEKPNRANETYYPWLVKFKTGIDYVFCKYCNFRFSRKANRLIHQKTKRHQEAEKEILAQEVKNKTPVKTPSDVGKNEHKERKSPIATPAQLKSMKAKIMEWQKRFVWLRFDKGLLLNYGYCTYCDKSVFMPSPSFAGRHQRSTSHIRARTEAKKQEKSNQIADDEAETAAEASSEKSSTSSFGPKAKRFRPSSLKTAIETAKRLTAAHLEMITFMQNNGQQKNDLLKKFEIAPTVQDNQTTKQVPPPPSSPSVDSIINTSISRDPFDLFFNSISETLKRLPADLASEGKLKVMQIIFDLEIRAQQRQNQTEVINTSKSSFNGSVLNTTTESTLNDLLGIHTDEAVATDTLIPKQIEQPQPQPNQLTQNQPQQNQHQRQLHKQHHQHQQQKRHSHNQQQQSPHPHPRSQNFYNMPAKIQNNSLLQQQLLQPHQPPQTQAPQPQQRNLVLQAHLNSGIQSGQMISSPNNTSPQRERNMYYKTTSSSDQAQSVLKQHRATNKLNYNNLNQRLNVNNTSITFTNTSTSTPISTSSSNRPLTNNQGTFVNDTRNNSVHPPPNKLPMIRPVPISSLTVKKYLPNDEPPYHHIQLNSSTQSKIIPLDTNRNTPR